MIRAIGFIDTAQLTSTFVLKFKDRMKDGMLMLRDFDPDDVEFKVADRPVLKEWKAATAILKRVVTESSRALGKKVDLGRAWLETLPGGHGTPWMVENDDYALEHVRTRTCILPAPDAYTYSGQVSAILNVGYLHAVGHTILHSEANFGPYARTHLIVDIKPIEPAEG